MTWHFVAKDSDFESDKGQLVVIEEKSIAIFKLEEKFHAIANACEHRGGPLVEGAVEDCHVVCPWHAWAFDLRDGKCVTNPRVQQECYPVKMEGGRVYVQV